MSDLRVKISLIATASLKWTTYTNNYLIRNSSFVIDQLNYGHDCLNALTSDLS